MKIPKNETLISICLVGFLFLLMGFLVDRQMMVLFKSIRVSFINGIVSWGSSLLTVTALIVLMTSLFLWKERKIKHIFALWISYGLSALISTILKFLIMRPRPFIEMPGINLITESLPSFPSLHAAIVFSTLPVLGKQFPKLMWFWLLFAVLVSLSRIYLGVHYLSDVIFGAMLGYGIGLLTAHIIQKYDLFKKYGK